MSDIHHRAVRHGLMLLRMLAGFLSPTGFSVLIFLLALALTGKLLAWIAPPDPLTAEPDIARQFLTIDPAALRPEPRERFVYFGLLLSVPALLAGVIALQRLLHRCSVGTSGDLLLWGTLISAGIAIRPWKIEPFATLAGLAGAASGWLFIVGGALALCAWRSCDRTRLASSASKTGYVAMLLASAVLTYGWLVFGPGMVDASGSFVSHWDAIFYAVNQIAAGGVCLHDVLPQYGCQGEFMRPLFALTGVSITKATLLFATLQFAALAAIFTFAFRLFIFPTAAAAACVWILIFSNRIVYRSADHYFQYMPIRLLFPALSLLLLRPWQMAPSRGRALAMGVFGGLAVFWNVDTGFVVLLALGLFVLVSGARTRAELLERFLYAAFYAGGVLIAAVGALAYLSLRAGVPVGPLGLVHFQRLFFLTGFYMLPMSPAPDYWTIAVGIYAATLASWAVRLASGSVSRSTEQAAYLALMGAGLFSYFVGRSHPEVFMLSAWPAVLLAFILIDRGAQSVSPAGWNIGTATCHAMGATALILGIAILASRSPAIAAVARKQWSSVVDAHRNSPLNEDVAFIAGNTSTGEVIGLLAENQSSLLAASGRRSAIPGPGLAETLTRRDAVRAVTYLIEQGPKHLFVEVALLKLTPQSYVLEPWVFKAYPALLAVYEPARLGPGGRLRQLVRKVRPVNPDRH